jgi:RNA polymerase sigma-70 factor, ECF subfamily
MYWQLAGAQKGFKSVSALPIQNISPWPFMAVPSWARGILFTVSSALQSQSSPDADSQDLFAARKGDGDAYARIIRRHQSTLARRMTRFARDRRTIEELVHDSFVEAYLSLRSFRGDSPFEHWLMKIATRVGYRHWKTQKRDRSRSLTLENYHPTNSTESVGSDSAELASFLLDRLSPRDRLAITLLHLEGRSVSEAAAMAGWSQTMMKVQAHRARKKLRTMLETQGIHHG